MAPVLDSATPTAVPLPTLDVRAILDASAVRYTTRRLARGAKVFAQGMAATSVYYIEQGGVTLTVVSTGGKEAAVGMLGAGDFCGEGCLAGQATRMGSATTVLRTVVLRIPAIAMRQVLHVHTAFAEGFLAHMLARNIRIEEDLVDQLFNSSEKRLARTLLLLARFGKEEESQRVIPKLSQEILAAMVGTTRSRVNFFMNKFRRLGFIEYNGSLKVHASLMSVVLHD
jgi:CRP/FNR family transcriptional regulator, cyclic AMP receptor protein